MKEERGIELYMDVKISDGVMGKGLGCVVSSGASYEEVLKGALGIAGLNRVSQWWLGDLLNQSRDLLGEEYEQLFWELQNAFGYTKGTLDQYAYVSKRVGIEDRGEQEFAFYQVVLKYDRDKRMELLKASKEGRMSVSEFRRYVRMLEDAGVNARGSGVKKGEAPVASSGGEVQYCLSRVRKEDGEIKSGSLYDGLVDPLFEFSEGQLLKMGIEPFDDGEVVVIQRVGKEVIDEESVLD